MAEIIIRNVRADEVENLRQLAIQTFKETFAYDNSPEQLQDYFDQAYSLDVLQAELNNSETLLCFIEVDGHIAGYLKVNWGAAQTEQELDDAFEIQRLYILQAFQGLGLGKKLFTYALEMAEQKQFTWVWLGVWEHNLKAQAFYKKYGFKRFSEHHFVVAKDKVDVDWLLRRKMN